VPATGGRLCGWRAATRHRLRVGAVVSIVVTTPNAVGKVRVVTVRK
jgi:hypothetical protein